MQILKEKVKQSWLVTLFSVIAIIVYFGTAGQLLTSLVGHHPAFGAWWLLKVAVSGLVIFVPMLLGCDQSSHHSRMGPVILLWIIGAVGFIWANFTTQPVLDLNQPSPEKYVVQQIFVSWLSATVLYLFADPLKSWLHRWNIVKRRHWILSIILAFFLIRFFNGYDVLGFHRGTSAIWFIFLFATGDWLANDQKWLHRWKNWQFALITLLSFLMAGLLTWLNMRHVIYSPHSGLTPNTHYLLAINAYQPMLVITVMLITAWLMRTRRRNWINEYNLIQLLLILGLLGTPQAITPMLLPKVKADLTVLVAIILLALVMLLPDLVLKLGKHWQINLDWHNVLRHTKSFVIRYWTILLTYAIFWLMTIGSFVYLWDHDMTMVQWVITKRMEILTVNVLIIMVLTFILMALTNRWLFSSIVMMIVYAGWMIASVLKIESRNEPILPTDVTTITAPKELLGMVDPWVIIISVIGIIIMVALAIVIEIRYGQKIRFNKWSRWLVAILSVCFLVSFTQANHSHSAVYKTLQKMGDTPYFYSQIRGAKTNGSLLQFANNLDVHVMTKPSGYSKAKMKEIAQRYQKEGKEINQNRTHNSVAGQNLVFVLSESFADARRIPGMKISGGDPLPFLHQFKKETTSGLMLSSGYGGGTANMEYMALTGLCVANFSPTMPTPYSQLVPYQKQTFTINNLFHYSIGIHPFTANLYSRKTVYKKFGFNKFYHFDGGSKITFKKKIQNNPRVSDDSTYKEIELNLKRHPHNQFIQAATMQNHMPYEATYYKHRHYKVSGQGFNNSDQRAQVETYIQGTHYTDIALRKWIHHLDSLKQPVTVVWYGDHLPGVYHGLSMGKYGVRLHETDYFIYSNKAARKMNHNRLKNNHQLVGPNDFIAMALAKMDVKVSPYYALLTRVQEDLPAMSLPTNGTAKNNTARQSGIAFVNQHGKHVALNHKQKRLFHDYQLVQYDLTAGHHYLLKNSFLKHVAK